MGKFAFEKASLRVKGSALGLSFVALLLWFAPASICACGPISEEHWQIFDGLTYVEDFGAVQTDSGASAKATHLAWSSAWVFGVEVATPQRQIQVSGAAATGTVITGLWLMPKESPSYDSVENFESVQAWNQRLIELGIKQPIRLRHVSEFRSPLEWLRSRLRSHVADLVMIVAALFS